MTFKITYFLIIFCLSTFSTLTRKSQKNVITETCINDIRGEVGAPHHVCRVWLPQAVGNS